MVFFAIMAAVGILTTCVVLSYPIAWVLEKTIFPILLKIHVWADVHRTYWHNGYRD